MSVDFTNSVATAKKARKSRRAGQVISRGKDKWLIRIFLGRDTAGKRHYHSELFVGKKKDADAHLRNLLARHRLGEPLRLSEITFGDFLDQWLQDVKLRVRERSHTHYSRMIDEYVRGTLGRRRLADVLPADITALYSAMNDRGLSAATIRLIHTLLTNAFKLALRREMIRKNPMLSVDAPKQQRREMTVLNGEQIRQLLEATKGTRYEAVFNLAFFTGARPCEYLSLKWSDLDLKSGKVTIQRSIVWRKAGDWYTTDPKTPAGRRSIPLSEALLAKLSEHRTRQLEDRMRAGAAWRDHGFIFCDQIGEPLHLGAMRYAFKGLLKAAGLPLATRFYDTRHSTATALIGSEINSKIVSERLGHSNVSVTLNTYTHVSVGMQQGASEEMEKVILG